jgi:hypothetical protein
MVKGVETKFSQHTTQQGIEYDLTLDGKIINDNIRSSAKELSQKLA